MHPRPLFPRREFLKTATASLAAAAISTAQEPASPPSSRTVLEPFDYHGVRLLPSRWLDQVQTARNYYFSLTNDDILQGFRAAAGLPAPGTPLGGWCEHDTSPIFGQWLSGMARL